MKNNLNQRDWFFLDSGVQDGSSNMACDNYLLDLVVNESINNNLLRVYGWTVETLSLGYSQNHPFSKISYPVVQRISGGQAVLHGTAENELTYSVFVSYEESAKKLYAEISKVLISFLGSLGLDAKTGYSDANYKNDFNCFNSKTCADIVIDDLKVIGSAQARKKNYIMQHGSIRLDIIRELLKTDITFNLAKLKLKSAFEIVLGIKFMDYSLERSPLPTCL